MMASLKALCVAVIALAALNFASAANSEGVLLKLELGFAKSVVVKGAAEGKFKAIIGNPEIADFTFGPQNTFWFIGKKEGATNVIVLDNATGKQMYAAKIVVAPFDTGVSRVVNHNKALLNSYTTYRCDPGCTIVDEVTVKEPAPLPKGHLDSSSTIHSNTVVPGSEPLKSSTTIRSNTEIR